MSRAALDDRFQEILRAYRADRDNESVAGALGRMLERAGMIPRERIHAAMRLGHPVAGAILGRRPPAPNAVAINRTIDFLSIPERRRLVIEAIEHSIGPTVIGALYLEDPLIKGAADLLRELRHPRVEDLRRSFDVLRERPLFSGDYGAFILYGEHGSPKRAVFRPSKTFATLRRYLIEAAFQLIFDALHWWEFEAAPDKEDPGQACRSLQTSRLLRRPGSNMAAHERRRLAEQRWQARRLADEILGIL